MSMRHGVETSELDSRRFGLRVGRADATGVEAAARICEAAAVLALDLLIVRCDAAAVATVHELERHGHQLMDTAVTFTSNLVGVPETRGPSTATVRSAHSQDAEAIASLARRAFRGYVGHYHADPRLPRELCDAVYADWAWRSVQEEGVADEVIVAEIDQRVVGFTTVRMRCDGSAQGPLDAVSPDARGQGVYSALGRARLFWCLEHNASSLSVETHLRNWGAQRGLWRLGFRPTSSRHTFHKWLTGSPHTSTGQRD